ncbi:MULTISPECIES: hypothetical protein [unclassified Flavobacterium]|uniref:hypothetical protein n=1 Tax=unclassified Flavobacterium TaxID=196869 RepID=UPI0012A9B1CC|nr:MULTISPECIES: hypothetical protein [unclassified Flavobacterium]MBF4488142.1 hypothetical protein [Flavobacterium sp. CSZ]QGK77136.1 hypothetical protein GIY83_24650 [Flavobacterium sp. SLB02]
MDDFLIYCGYLLLAVTVGLYSFSFFRKEKANVFLLLYLVFSFLVQFGMEVLYHLKMKNLLLMNFFFIGQMVLLGLFYRSLYKYKVQKKFVLIALGFTLLILLARLVYNPGLQFKFDLFQITVSSLLTVVFALIHFYNMITENKQYYYLTIGIIGYMFGSTVLFLVGNLTVGLSNDVKYLSWRLNAFLFIVYYFFILFEWIKSFSKKNAEL